MPHSLVVTIPYPCRVRLARCDIGIPIEHIDHGVLGMRKGGNPDPIIDFAGRGVVAFLLEIQLVGAGSVGSKDDVIAIGIVHDAAIGPCREVRIGAREENREIRLVGVRDPCMIDRDRAEMEISAGIGYYGRVQIAHRPRRGHGYRGRLCGIAQEVQSDARRCRSVARDRIKSDIFGRSDGKRGGEIPNRGGQGIRPYDRRRTICGRRKERVERRGVGRIVEMHSPRRAVLLRHRVARRFAQERADLLRDIHEVGLVLPAEKAREHDNRNNGDDCERNDELYKGKPVLFHDHNLERTRELIGRHNDGKRDNRDGDQEFLKAESLLSH